MSSSRVPSRRVRRTFGVAFLLLMGLSTVWNLAVPRVSAPDESSHLPRAAAVVRGELTGHGPSVAPSNQTRTMSKGLYLYIDVPQSYQSAFLAPVCFAFDVNHPAGCEPQFSTSGRSVPFSTYVARYQPVYYLLVGAPTLVLSSQIGSYAVRFLSSVICDLFLAFAFTLAIAFFRNKWMAVGLILAVSPMVLYLSAVVNPSALEVSTAVCFWTVLASITLSQDHRLPRYQLGWLAASGALLATARPSSPGWILVAVACMSFVFFRDGRWRHLLRASSSRVAIVIIGVGTIFSLGWTSVEHATLTFITPLAHGGINEILRGAAGNATDYLQEAIGIFGLDARVPEIVVFIWVGLLGSLVLAAYARTDRAGRRSLMLVLLSVLLVPSLTVAAIAPTHGYIGFGRYFLPLYVGLPIFAGAIMPASDEDRDRHRIRPVIVAVAFCQLLAFYWCVHRYLVGDQGSLSPLAQPPGVWHPPLPAILLELLYVVLIVAAGLLLAQAMEDGPERGRQMRGRAPLVSPGADVPGTEPSVVG